MKCELCGAQAAVTKKTTKNFGRGASLVVIEDIPTIHCTNCHESYVTADTAREIDRIRKNRSGRDDRKGDGSLFVTWSANDSCRRPK